MKNYRFQPPTTRPNYLSDWQWERLLKHNLDGMEYITFIPKRDGKDDYILFVDKETNKQYVINIKHLKLKTQTPKLGSKIVNFCRKCEKEIKSHEVIFPGGLCSSCYKDDFKKTNYFHYHDTDIRGCYMGIEIEIDDKNLDFGDDPDDWGDIPKIKGWKNKRDGSLNKGREFVSPIMPPNLLKEDLKRLALAIQKYNIGCGNAGIHIHVNKKYYLSDLNTKKILKLFYKLDESYVIRLFGRGYNMYSKKIYYHWDNTAHYNLVNTENHTTIEFRGFAAYHTLNWYMYVVDLTLLICEYVRKTGYSQINFNNFFDNIKNMPKMRRNFHE